MKEVFKTQAEANACKIRRENLAVHASVIKLEFERNSGQIYALWVCKSALRPIA